MVQDFNRSQKSINFLPLRSHYFLIPVLKLLADRLRRQENNQSNPGAGESAPEAIHDQSQLLKAHTLIKALQAGPLRNQDMRHVFFKLLDCLHLKDYLKSALSQRKQVGLYDILRQLPRSQQSIQLPQQADSILIMKGLYGKPHSYLRRE